MTTQRSVWRTTLAFLAVVSTVGPCPAFGSTPTVVDGSTVGLGIGTQLRLVPLASGFDRPIDVEFRPGVPGAFVVEQRGTVWHWVEGERGATPFLDITDRVSSRGERGLLGLAFAPDGSDAVYVHYTDRRGTSVVASYGIAGGVAVVSDEAVVLRQTQPFANHNGGDLDFGPDGALYVAFGDGGGAFDPVGAGRDLTTWLGKILRLHVTAHRDGYAIPADNPFAGGGGRPEIWVSGLRNPWRMAFDHVTGDLWIGDVGQNRFEEVDVVPAGASGLDFGWSDFEGFAPVGTASVDPSAVTFPSIVYEHGSGMGRSITGGFVHRGDAIPQAHGAYLFGDFVSGRLMAWLPSSPDSIVVLGDTRMNVSALAETPDGDVWIVDHSAGALWQLIGVP